MSDSVEDLCDIIVAELDKFWPSKMDEARNIYYSDNSVNLMIAPGNFYLITFPGTHLLITYSSIPKGSHTTMFKRRDVAFIPLHDPGVNPIDAMIQAIGIDIAFYNTDTYNGY